MLTVVRLTPLFGRGSAAYRMTEFIDEETTELELESRVPVTERVEKSSIREEVGWKCEKMTASDTSE